MSASSPRSWRGRAAQVVVLLVTLGLAFAARHGAPSDVGVLGAIGGLGLLLLVGTLASELVEIIGLPHLSGYLLAGIVAGPHVLNLVEHDTVERLGVVNALALALIALAGGAELRVDSLKRVMGSLAWATLWQMVLVTAVTAGTFIALARFIPFLDGMAPLAAGMVALLWGVLATSRSPAAVLGLVTQIRPKGPLTEFTVAFVMASDVVVIAALAVVMALARLGVDPTATFQMSAFTAVGHELLGSAALGTTLGLGLSLYLRLSSRGLLLVLLTIGFSLTALLRYVHLDPLLSFMVAGFVVQNFSSGGEKLLNAVEKTGAIVFVVFFATAGAHLDLPLLGRIWPIALGLAAVRMAATIVAARAASQLAKDEPVLKRWGWSGLVSQAGLTLGLTMVIARAFPEFGDGFRTLAIGVVGINEMVGPVLFKLGLDRAHESGRGLTESS